MRKFENIRDTSWKRFCMIWKKQLTDRDRNELMGIEENAVWKNKQNEIARHIDLDRWDYTIDIGYYDYLGTFGYKFVHESNSGFIHGMYIINRRLKA